MSRRTSNGGHSQRGQRDLFTPQPTIARPPTLYSPKLGLLTPHKTLQLIGEDRRVYQPTPRLHRAAASLRPAHARILPKNVDRFGKAIRALPFGIRFGLPRNVAICIRRNIRKQVLFAKKRTGSNSSRNRKHRNFWSKVTC